MCFTGGFALGMMVDDVVVAPVLSQPSLPFPVSRSRRRAVGLSESDTQRVRQRALAGTCVLGLRFSGDTWSPPERFEHLRELLGDAFVAVELDSTPGNPHGHKKMAHSVLTEDLDDRPGTPTRDALDQVLSFFRERLAA
jgi:dienelactone hydrolase